MPRKQLLILVSLILTTGSSFITPVTLARDGRPNVVVNVVALKEVVQRDTAGRETIRLEPAGSSGPGDTLVYRIVYRNEGTAPARDAQVVDPIPEGTLLVPGSWDAAGGEFTVSVDGGKTFERFPARRSVRQADGSTTLAAVDLFAYTHVRWSSTEPLGPGGSRSTAFKVKVR